MDSGAEFSSFFTNQSYFREYIYLLCLYEVEFISLFGIFCLLQSLYEKVCSVYKRKSKISSFSKKCIRKAEKLLSQCNFACDALESDFTHRRVENCGWRMQSTIGYCIQRWRWLRCTLGAEDEIEKAQISQDARRAGGCGAHAAQPFPHLGERSHLFCGPARAFPGGIAARSKQQNSAQCYLGPFCAARINFCANETHFSLGPRKQSQQTPLKTAFALNQ